MWIGETTNDIVYSSFDFFLACFLFHIILFCEHVCRLFALHTCPYACMIDVGTKEQLDQ